MVSLQEYYYYVKIVGASSSAGGAVYGIYSWIKSSYNQVKKVNDNVVLLMTNHFPHLQASLDSHSASLQSIKSDVKTLDSKFLGLENSQEVSRAAVNSFGESLVRHIESETRKAQNGKTKRCKPPSEETEDKIEQKALKALRNLREQKEARSSKTIKEI